MLETGPSTPATGRPHALSVFRHGRYRLYLFSTVVSQVGTWMQYVAEGVLIYRLTHAPLALGLLGFLPLVPLAPLTLVAGALADRVDRRRLLIAVQMVAVFPPLILAVLVWTSAVQVWHVIAIEVALQALSAFDLPARQALVVDTVEPGDLDAGVALSASVFNLARVLGPALGGVLAAGPGGAGICFALNGASFLASGLALWRLHLPRRERHARRQPLGANLAGGVGYLLRDPLLPAAVLLVLAVSLFVMPFQRFLPVFALELLGIGEVGVGTINAAAGLGAVLGAVTLARIVNTWRGRRGRLALGLGLVLPLAAAGFALSRDVWLSFLLVLFVGAGVVAVRSLAFTLVQVYVHDELRGRVLSIMLLISVGAVRVGELGTGVLADYAGGVSGPLVLGAGCCLIAMLALAGFAPHLRRAA